MTILSYAADFGDVPLWRALDDGDTGVYVDWASGALGPAPAIDALYDRGWRGVTLRPTQADASALRRARPRDYVISLQGETSPDLPALVRMLGANQAHVARVDMAEHQDVAVAATLVLAPLLVLVRADTASGHVLTASGYCVALCDGPTHLYIAMPHFDRVASRLRHATMPAREQDLSRRVATLEALLKAAQLRESGSLRRMREAVTAAGRARADISNMAAESKWLRGIIDDCNRNIDALQHRVEELNTLALTFMDRTVCAEAALQRSMDARIRTRLRRLDRWNLLPRLWRHLVHPGRGDDLASPTPFTAPEATAALPAPADQNERTASISPDGITSDTGGIPDKPVSLPSPAVITTVHQFHAGSAPGDAITNSMLLIRTLLRARGFRSDIYVQQRPDSLMADGILLLDELPRHAGYVLLLHHSMGFAAFDQILALPAPKILIYHNITPAHFLSAISRIEQGARLGREQLAMLRDRVAVALADSDYNATELHELGFSEVRTCPLLFDLAEVTRRAIGPKLVGDTFIVLFVGRVTPSKAQDDLIEAFANFRSRFDRPSRLVLVGALDADEHAFLNRLDAIIGRHDLHDAIQLTGLVSDDELHDWYRQADLYVSLSQHEGFGVPLVEALAHGIPVLAFPDGAVAETLGHNGILLSSRQAEAVATDMLTAATASTPLRPADLSRFALPRHVPTLLQALTACGASAPPDAAAHQQLAAKLHVAVAGHVGKSYSLAAVNRAMATVLERERPGSVRVIGIEGIPTDDLDEVPPGERPLIEQLASRAKPDNAPELMLSQHYPVYVPPEPAALKAALFFWEESIIPATTVAKLCTGFDAVFAPTRFVARALIDSGVSCPVITIGHAPILDGLDATGATAKQGPFTFLHISSAFPRKGIDVLLLAWSKAFRADDTVRLVLKTFPNPHNDAPQQLARLQATQDVAPIELVDADLPADALQRLLAQADAMVLPTRGEGYNLPAAEAMAAGIALITTAYGGHMDFCRPDTVRLVRRTLHASASHLATPHSLWAEPDVDDLAAALREVYRAGRDGLAAQRGAARAAIAAAAKPSAWVNRIGLASAALLLAEEAPPARIAWISTWNVGCGIAEYSRMLLEAMPSSQVTLLAEDRTAAAPDVAISWRLGDPTNVERLVQAVGRLDADVVMVQHQPGLLDWSTLAQLVSILVDQGRAVMVTLHNTRHLVGLPEGERRTIVKALNLVARVLVHTLADVQALEAIGLTSGAVLLPHSALAAATPTLRLLPKGSGPVVGSTGFFLPGKGIGTLIQAVANLRDSWPGIQLRLVNAQYDHPNSLAEIAACRELAERESLAVEWLTQFTPLSELTANLAGCDLVVLPYEQSKESSSAALRTALGTGLPVAVTPIPIFDEAGQAVARFAGVDVASVTQGLSHLLADDAARRRLQSAARKWLDGHQVTDIAQRLHGMMQGLAAQRHHGQRLNGDVWEGPPGVL